MSQKRLLTEYEIDDILSFIKPNRAIPPESAQVFAQNNKKKLYDQLVGQLIYPELIPELKRCIEHQYMTSQVPAGESVGLITAQSIGERQTQLTLNSVDWFDVVLYVVGNKTFVEPIGKMIDTLLEENTQDIELYQENKTEYLALPDGYYIPSIDKYGFNKWRKIEAVTRHLPNGNLVKVTTSSGRTVTASQSKSFLVWDGNTFIDTLGSEVKIGDILPTTKNTPRFGKIQEYAGIFQLDKEFGFLAGVILACGWITNKTFIGINIIDKNIRKRVTDWCDRYNIIYHDNVDNLKLYSIWLTKVMGKKCIPNFVYTTSDEFIKGLIDGYVSGDGYVNMEGGVVLSSLSEQLIQGISFLLSYFGVFGEFSNRQDTKIKGGRVYILTIMSGFAIKFSKHITLTEEKKQSRLLNKNIYMNKKGEKDVYFDPIISIEYVNATNGVVYDFTISDTKNFQLFNGLNVRDTFHTAGKGESAVTQGVPRFCELLNATKSPKGVSCFVYFNKGNESIAKLRETLCDSIVEIKIKKVMISYDIMINKQAEEWYDSFAIMYGDKYRDYKDCLSLKINMDLLYEYKFTMDDIAEALTEYSDIVCVWSPDNIGQFDIFVDTQDINLPEDRLLFIDQDNAVEIYLEEVVQPIIENVVICGINGIKDIFFNKDGEDRWMVETVGSNLRELFSHPDVDMSRTFSNNMWDIYNTLGIEATREFLIREFMSLMAGINECHVKILVERMTFDGSIASISRYTMRSDSSGGPLSRCSFEETVDNFLKAGIFGQQEPTTGVSASIICGKRANIGTGLCEIRMDVSKLPYAIPIIKDEIKENKPVNKMTYIKKRTVF